CLAARRLLRVDCREGHLELAHWCAGRVRRKGQDRPAGRARRAGGDSWCRYLRRRHPHSAVMPVVNALVSLAHIGMTERRQPRRARPANTDRTRELFMSRLAERSGPPVIWAVARNATIASATAAGARRGRW